MSQNTRINLQIVKHPDIELIDYGVLDIRVYCDILFQPYDYTNRVQPVLAVIDTGAPMSVIPESIWSKCFTKIIQEEAYLSGIIPGPSHMMKTKIGIISAELLDKAGNHYPISFCAHLSPARNIPVILGMQDILERAIVHIDTKGEKSWLEFK